MPIVISLFQQHQLNLYHMNGHRIEEMENYFDREIKQINQEILMLKTSSQKSAGIVPTTAKTISLNVGLSLNSSRTDCSGSATYRVLTDSNSLLMITLDKYYDDVTKNQDFPRTTRYTNWVISRDNNDIFYLRVYSYGNQTDLNNLKNGNTVSVPVKLSIRSTDNFELVEI